MGRHLRRHPRLPRRVRREARRGYPHRRKRDRRRGDRCRLRATPRGRIMTMNFAFLAMDQIVNDDAKLHYMFNGQIGPPGIGPRSAAAGSSERPIRRRRMWSLPTSRASRWSRRARPPTPRVC